MFHTIFHFGIVHLFVLAILDSTIFFFFPFALDAGLIIMVSKHRSWMPLYASVAAAGSIIGCALTYYLVGKTSEKTLEKILPKKKFERVKTKIQEKGFLAIVVAALLPPPFPFTPFVVTAAISKFPERKMLGAITLGRFLRYMIDGALALIFGRHIIRLLRSPILIDLMIGAAVLALLAGIVSFIKWMRLREPHKETSH